MPHVTLSLFLTYTLTYDVECTVSCYTINSNTTDICLCVGPGGDVGMYDETAAGGVDKLWSEQRAWERTAGGGGASRYLCYGGQGGWLVAPSCVPAVLVTVEGDPAPLLHILVA